MKKAIFIVTGVVVAFCVMAFSSLHLTENYYGESPAGIALLIISPAIVGLALLASQIMTDAPRLWVRVKLC